MTTLCLSYKIYSRIADEDGVMMVNEGTEATRCSPWNLQVRARLDARHDGGGPADWWWCCCGAAAANLVLLACCARPPVVLFLEYTKGGGVVMLRCAMSAVG
jgi:hypothetical protein